SNFSPQATGTLRVGPGVDLRHADLSGAWLLDFNLSHARLDGANLVGATLNLANLHGATLRSANLRHALLNQADMQNTDLRFADLRGVWATDSCFRGAALQGARLTGLRYSAYTEWPAGFDPKAQGAVLVE